MQNYAKIAQKLRKITHTCVNWHNLHYYAPPLKLLMLGVTIMIVAATSPLSQAAAKLTGGLAGGAFGLRWPRRRRRY